MNGIEAQMGADEKKPEYKAWCFCCGEPIEIDQIGERFIGKSIKSLGCKTADVELHVCKSCNSIRENWFVDGIKGAIKRKQALCNLS